MKDSSAPRRIVTGLDADGRSAIVFDGPDGFVSESEALKVTLLWRSDRAPASNAGNSDAASEAFSFALGRGGTKFLLVEFSQSDELVDPGMHATDTLDYGILLSGRIDLIVETGGVSMRPGDVIVDRGIIHGWRNRAPETARMLFVNVDAEPVGRGATV